MEVQWILWPQVSKKGKPVKVVIQKKTNKSEEVETTILFHTT